MRTPVQVKECYYDDVVSEICEAISNAVGYNGTNFECIIQHEFPDEVMEKVKYALKESGWDLKSWVRSSENGERAGLMGLKLNELHVTTSTSEYLSMPGVHRS